jgi:hypothetical protein
MRHMKHVGDFNNNHPFALEVKIYDTIGTNAQLKEQFPDALVQALDALKNYVKYDDKKQLLIVADGYKPLNVIYPGLFQAGVSNYEAKKYDQSLMYFSAAVGAIDLMYKNGWIKQSMDSTSLLYAGISAEKNNKRDKRRYIIKRSQIPESPGSEGNDMAEIYKWLADYYTRKGDRKQMQPNMLHWANQNIRMISFMMNYRWMN